jgi:hypothetical protein
MNHPLANATLKEVHDYPWPDPAWMDVTKITSEAMAYDGQYAILGGDWSPFWHDAIDLLGMENLYMKMYDEPQLADAVMQHMVDYYAAVSRRIFDAAGDAIDIFFIGNDLGSQTGPLLSPELFERFVLPHLRRLIDLGHSYDLKVQLHCCGGFAPLIPLLIEAGLDGLHAIQPACYGMDLAELKTNFGDKILFNGAIDSHHVLIEGTPGTVRTKTQEVLDIMAPGGGYVAGASHDTFSKRHPSKTFWRCSILSDNTATDRHPSFIQFGQMGSGPNVTHIQFDRLSKFGPGLAVPAFAQIAQTEEVVSGSFPGRRRLPFAELGEDIDSAPFGKSPLCGPDQLVENLVRLALPAEPSEGQSLVEPRLRGTCRASLLGGFAVELGSLFGAAKRLVRPADVVRHLWGTLVISRPAD